MNYPMRGSIVLTLFFRHVFDLWRISTLLQVEPFFFLFLQTQITNWLLAKKKSYLANREFSDKIIVLPVTRL